MCKHLRPIHFAGWEQWQTYKVLCSVLGVNISHGHDYTSCATLGHFDVEHVDMILRHYPALCTTMQNSIIQTTANVANVVVLIALDFGLEWRPTFAACRRCILFTCQVLTLSHPVALFSPPLRT